jgi:3-dehydroquinate dehydratase / shikimate dehydrogenase
MNHGKICVSVCGRTADEVVAKMKSAGELADVIEIRFDCLDPDQIEPLIEKIATDDRQLLITFRPAGQGGARSLTRDERIAFWELVATRLRNEPLVDLELDVDFPTGIAEDRIIASAHYFDRLPDDLSDVFEKMLSFGCGGVKLAAVVNDAPDAVDVWNLLDHFDRPAIPIAMGEAGKWTRILGLAYSAPLTYASLDLAGATAPGQISAKDLRDVYRAKELTPRSHIYAVLAGDTSYSLSPYMHNAAFKSEGLDSAFVPMQVSDLEAFMRRMVKGATRETELHFRGFSITNPHKQTVVKYLDRMDEAAQKIGAVNTIKVEGGKLIGYNTDAPGFIGPLERAFGDLRDARVAVVGAGGAARAVVYALKNAGAEVTLLARDQAKASSFADEFDISVDQLTADDRSLGPETDILVNATPAGTRGEQENAAIFSADELRGVRLVYDLVYNPVETRLIQEAKSAGIEILGGLEMLIAQGARQFEIWTGRKAPVDEMKRAVTTRLN